MTTPICPQFLYTFTQGRTPRDGSGIPYTAKVMKIAEGHPQLVGEKTDTFVSEFQLVMDILEEHRALPVEAFERNARHNARKYESAWALKEAGIANIQKM